VRWFVLDAFGPGVGPVAGCFEHNIPKEPSRFLKGGKFIEMLSNYQFSRRTFLYGFKPSNE
jgi:hypothetical protein